MSLVPFAIRVATVRALQSALPASVAVLDSPQDAVALLDDGTPQPLVAVYTGHSVAEIQGRGLHGGARTVDLSLQIFIPESITFSYGAGLSLTIDTRRQGAETALDILCRETIRCLNESEDPWATLLRQFVPQMPRELVSSYLVETSKIKITAREVVLTCDTIHEPIAGGAPADAWAQLLTLMRADDGEDGLPLLSDWLESEIRGGADLPQAQRDRFYIGISKDTSQAIDVEPTVHDIGSVPVPEVEELAGVATLTDPQT